MCRQGSVCTGYSRSHDMLLATIHQNARCFPLWVECPLGVLDCFSSSEAPMDTVPAWEIIVHLDRVQYDKHVELEDEKDVENLRGSRRHACP